MPLLSGQVIAQVKFSEGYEAAHSGNYKKAVKIWLPLAEKGDAPAQYTIGWMYESGQGVKKDLKKAVYWYKKSAEQEYEAAQYVLGTLYEKGEGVEQNSEAALSYYLLAAEQGDPISQFQVGNYYQYGIGTYKNNDKSIFWYEKAAEQSHVNAQIDLGKIYQSGEALEIDYEKAVHWYQAAAAQNNAVAQYQLAYMYEHGLGKPQNYTKAIQLYSRSANNDYSQAAFKLGTIFESGASGEVDNAKALSWYRRAALQGNTDAQFQLGYLSEIGKGTEKSIQRAIDWYTQASRRDNAEAYYILGQIYEKGTTDYRHNIAPNLQKAVKNYQYASELNYPLAHAKLAYFYETGIFTHQDKEAAIALYQKSPQKWAKERLTRLVSHDNCLKEASTKLFDELISCANRDLLRAKIKQQSIKVISEDDQLQSDTYFTGAVIRGTSELTMQYDQNNGFSKATYTYIGRNKPELIDQVKDKLIEQYGLPSHSIGDPAQGEASYHWILKDNIMINAYRSWPDTTTFVEYELPEQVTNQYVVNEVE
ncbi:tetratricopeptide repeat protein [Psychromonas sp. B3M02]|uniref:tetratricopeptide repeat protein n=1 Tax=Psychromonas sp. B3M02 TaxID=2267226 RepID=UPI0015EFE8CD|nr:SEL1-like repeat protein [Psychromonas sp. B3M02]